MPDAGYMRLYREIMLDVWRKKQGDNEQEQAVLSRKVKELRENKSRLDEAFVYQKALTKRPTKKCAEAWLRN